MPDSINNNNGVARNWAIAVANDTIVSDTERQEIIDAARSRADSLLPCSGTRDVIAIGRVADASVAISATLQGISLALTKPSSHLAKIVRSELANVNAIVDANAFQSKVVQASLSEGYLLGSSVCAAWETAWGMQLEYINSTR